MNKMKNKYIMKMKKDKKYEIKPRKNTLKVTSTKHTHIDRENINRSSKEPTASLHGENSLIE